MTGPLSGKTVVLGVTGGIAAYKACEIVSRLKKLGAGVRVILTKNAARFVSPLSFEALAGYPVVSDMFDEPRQWEIEHISWAKAADVFIVAPATANLIAKCANGIADDMLTSTLLATRAPVLIAPAMNVAMWQHPATRRNLETLLSRGVKTVGPGSGYLACGDVDEGRMAEAEEIVAKAVEILLQKRDLSGRRVLVTAGPTREMLDPVRYLTNHSSGKMGYAIAEAALSRGAEVTLVTGPVTLRAPAGATVVPVETTQDLYEAVTARAPAQDILVQAAAPCDFRPAEAAAQKIKKQAGDALVLRLSQTPDVAAAVGRMKRAGQFIIAFAAETEHLAENAQKKLIRKNADLIVANDVTREGAGFGADTNIASFVTAEGVRDLPRMTKRALAEKILDAAIERLTANG